MLFTDDEGWTDFDPTGLVAFTTICRELTQPRRRIEYGIIATAHGVEHRFPSLSVTFSRLDLPPDLYEEVRGALAAGRLYRIGPFYLEGIERPAARPYANWMAGRRSYHGPRGFPPRATFDEREAREAIETYLALVPIHHADIRCAR